MKKHPILLYVCMLLFTSCGSAQSVLYFQDVADQKHIVSNQRDLVFRPNDLLSIIVSNRNTELTQPFNLINAYGSNSSHTLGYTIDADGTIDYPVLGKIKALGLTRTQLQDTIKRKLIEEGMMADPVVTIQLLNFKIAILGEVSRPGTYTITNERLTLLEALSMAGDLTISGRRDRVAIAREEGKIQTVTFVDIRTTDIFTSPYYYLQQNDMIYVEPNKVRAQTSGRANLSTTISITSFLMSLTSFALIFFR